MLLGKVLQKLIANYCRHSLVALPLWMAQTWFPTMLSMMMAPPVLLPNQWWLVTDQLGVPAWPMRWPLLGCYLSGDMELAKGFRKTRSKNVPDAKNGYPARHDAHFEKFSKWWDLAQPTVECSPSAIRPGLLAQCLTEQARRYSRARALPHCKWRADTFKRVAETGPRLANAVGKGWLSLTDFLPEVEK
jgi:hypothetical protein